jgi:hypothetical protein
MEEGQERDSSSDEQRHIIDDDDMEDSPRHVIPTKKHPESVSELSIVEQRKKFFKDLVKGGNEH